MEISPIRTEADYLAVMVEIDQLAENDPPIGTPEGDKLDVLLILAEAYEEEHYPIGPPDPIEAIKFRMEQSGLEIADLVPLIGKPNRVYEVLNGKRPLTLRMIRNLNRELGIPTRSLIGSN